jgi:glutaconate CoA-transferase subunit A
MTTTLEAMIATIPDGAQIALAPDYSGVAMAAAFALIARDARELHLIAVPQAGLQVDLLVGAGAARIVEAAGINLGEYGLAPRFTAAVQAGRLQVRDATCPAIYAGLQAAEKGIPFMPLRGILGSDLLKVRPDWRVIDNPYGTHDPIVLIPAITPDVALFHAPFADRAGNVWIGIRRELMLMAHAARRTLVTVEKIIDEDLLADPARAAGTIPALYVSAISQVQQGSWPIGLFDTDIQEDAAVLTRYVELAQTQGGFDEFLVECRRRAA